MCRFLMMRSSRPFEAMPALECFRKRCRESIEFQGHGWGAAWRADGSWSRYRSLKPIWEDTLELPESVDFLVLHARSAFGDRDIAIENNMPFYEDERIFVFNGELRGVRLSVPGRIGAEKVFRLVRRHESEGLPRAISRADSLLLAKSRYVRALNVAVTDGEAIHASCRYNESPEYFTLHYRDDHIRAVCSEPLDAAWKPMANGELRSL
jgi:glutamine amidotransferase